MALVTLVGSGSQSGFATVISRLSLFARRCWSHRLVRQAAEMLGWRFLSTLFGAAGAIWAARCLGPEALGVSGLLLAVGGNVVYVIGLQMNSAFVRRYKAVDSEAERLQLVSELTSFRFFASAALGGLVLGALPLLNLEPHWMWPVVACVPFVILSSLDLGWVLVARQDQPIQQRVVTVRNLLTTLAYLAFFRPGVAAGWDIIIADVVLLVSVGMTWHHAVGRNWGLIRWSAARTCLIKLWEERVIATSAFVTFGYYSTQMPLVGALATVRDTGLVRSAYQIVAPFERTLRMLNGLLYPKLIDWHREDPERLRSRQRRIVAVCLGAGALCAVVGALVLPTALPWVLGSDFEGVGIPCALLLAARCVLVGQESLYSGLWAQYREKEVIWCMGAMVPLLAGALWWSVPRYGALGAAGALLAGECVATGLLYLITMRNRSLAGAPLSSPASPPAR